MKIELEQRFGEWTVIKIDPKIFVLRVFCRCSCGREDWVAKQRLSKGTIYGCGDCTRKMRIEKRKKSHQNAHKVSASGYFGCHACGSRHKSGTLACLKK